MTSPHQHSPNPIPPHLRERLLKGERREDRRHRLKWFFAFLGLLFAAGAAAYFFGPDHWREAIPALRGEQASSGTVSEWAQKHVVQPTRDRLAPEHREVTQAGIFEAIEALHWTPDSDLGEVQTTAKNTWTRDYVQAGDSIRVKVTRLESRAAAREYLAAVTPPRRGLRFARRVVVLQPLLVQTPDRLDKLVSALEAFRRLVDEAEPSP